MRTAAASPLDAQRRLTEAIDALRLGRATCRADEAAAVLREIMAGDATEVEIAGFLIALRTKGETVDELAGPGAARCARSPRRSTRGRDDLLDTAGHRRRAPDLQRLHHGGADRRRRRLRGGQARQPLGHRALGLGRRARGAGRAHRPDARRGGALHRRGRLRLHVRARPPPGHALRGARCARSWRCARSSTSSARSPTRRARTRQLIGVSDPAYLETIAGALARLGARRALVVSSDDGLDEMSTSGTHAGRRGATATEHRALHGRAGRTSACAASAPDAIWRAARPRHNAATARRILAGEHGPRARPRAC